MVGCKADCLVVHERLLLGWKGPVAKVVEDFNVVHVKSELHFFTIAIRIFDKVAVNVRLRVCVETHLLVLGAREIGLDLLNWALTHLPAVRLDRRIELL